MSDATIDDSLTDDSLTDDDEPRAWNNGWTSGDFWMAAGMFVLGAATTAVAWAMSDGIFSVLLSLSAWFIGPILTILGLHGVVRSLYALSQGR